MGAPSTSTTVPASIEVILPATGPLGRRDAFGGEAMADRVSYRAFSSPATPAPGVVVSVTAFSSESHLNKLWVDGRFFVADGLDSSQPPSWVPDAPDWFWAEVAAMQHQAVTR